MKNNLFTRCIALVMILSASIVFADKPVRPKPGPAQKPDQSFKISDEELKALNLNDNDAQELKQFFDALNNLTPTQKQELEDLGRVTEDKMRKQGLDPNNMDDLMKFMEKEGLTQQQPKRPVRKAPVKKKPRPVKIPKPTESVAEPVTSPADTATMLRDLSKHLASLRQKVVTRESLYNKFDMVLDEVAQLGFYLNIIQSPDMVSLLTNKQFIGLHKALETLHKNFMRYEPSISARKRSLVVNEDDPYDVLDIPYNATQQEIEEQFKKLKAAKSPKAIAQKLKDEGVDEGTIGHIVKAATRTFDLIEQSYNKINDPEKRKIVDETLSDIISSEQQKEEQSQRAFGQLYNAMKSAFTMDKILPQLHTLLEKHKPQQAAQLKAQVAREKAAYERSKKKVTVPQLRGEGRVSRFGGPYDPFYRKMGQRRYRRPMRGPHYRPRRPMPGRGRPGAPSSASEKAAEEEKKKDKKKDEKKKDDKKKDTKKDDKKAPSEDTRLETKERGKLYSSYARAKNVFKDVKDGKGEVTVKRPALVAGGLPTKIKVKFDDIHKRLEGELLNTKADQHAADDLKEYFDHYRLGELERALKGIALMADQSKGPAKKIASEEVKDIWEELQPDAKDVLARAETIHKQLNFFERNNTPKPPIVASKIKHYGLDVKVHPYRDPWEKPKDDGAPTKPVPPAPAGADLGEVRSTASSIMTYIKKLNEAVKK